jgi:hypothetical protein
VIESGLEMARIGSARVRQSSGQMGIVPPGVEHSSWTETKAVIECIVHVKTRRREDVADSIGMSVMPTWDVEPAPPTTGNTIANAFTALKGKN